MKMKMMICSKSPDNNLKGYSIELNQGINVYFYKIIFVLLTEYFL